jgi:gas vesicle protein
MVSINFNYMAKNNKLFMGVLLGAAAGAAIGYLLTTEKGKEILSDLKDAAGKAGGQAKDLFSTAKKTATESFGRGKEYADSVKHN